MAQQQSKVIEFAKHPPKILRTQMDTIIINAEVIAGWKDPPFQRPFRVTPKVREVVENIKEAIGVIPGVITIGVMDVGKMAGNYLLDGQHRIKAFGMTRIEEGYADVRVCHFDDMGEMALEFDRLNTPIVAQRPDDKLRSLELAFDSVKIIREGCPFVGYDYIRRSANSPIVSMSLVLRSWVGSMAETPVQAPSAAQLAKDLTEESAQQLVVFLNIAMSAWGRDQEYSRLWGALNLTICMWMWRRLVLDKERGIKRYVVLNNDLFRKCLMSVSADTGYVDWLLGRHLSNRDRSPGYQRLKQIFARRLTEEGKGKGGKVLLPQPAWIG